MSFTAENRVAFDVICEPRTLRYYVEQNFLNNAVVKDADKGIIGIPSLNQRVNTRFMRMAAELIRFHYKEIPFDTVVGIPDSGNTFATLVSEQMDIELAESVKDRIPEDWEEPLIVNGEGKSLFVFAGLQKCERVLVIDDMIGNGRTALRVMNVLKENGFKPEFAAYYVKLFQPGVQRLRVQGINPYYVIGVEGIKDGRVKLAQPHD